MFWPDSFRINYSRLLLLNEFFVRQRGTGFDLADLVVNHLSQSLAEPGVDSVFVNEPTGNLSSRRVHASRDLLLLSTDVDANLEGLLMPLHDPLSTLVQRSFGARFAFVEALLSTGRHYRAISSYIGLKSVLLWLAVVDDLVVVGVRFVQSLAGLHVQHVPLAEGSLRFFGLSSESDGLGRSEHVRLEAHPGPPRLALDLVDLFVFNGFVPLLVNRLLLLVEALFYRVVRQILGACPESCQLLVSLSNLRFVGEVLAQFVRLHRLNQVLLAQFLSQELLPILVKGKVLPTDVGYLVRSQVKSVAILSA